MPRFGDQWVIDKTMFDYSMGGACACCSFGGFLPNGTEGMIRDMSDLDTDAANAEVAALEKSPWPVDMRDRVWSDRLKLRHLMKKEIPQYCKFWKEHGCASVSEASCSNEGFSGWLKSRSPLQLRILLQCPRSMISEKLNNHYGIHAPFATVLDSVMDQVANYPLTGLPTDGKERKEIDFEEHLVYDRRGGFTMNVLVKGEEEYLMNNDVVNILLRRIESLGSNKLLERSQKRKKYQRMKDSDEDDDDEDEEEEDDDDDPDEGLALQEKKTAAESSGPSFAPDRRIIRLLIARYWADQLCQKYLTEKEK